MDINEIVKKIENAGNVIKNNYASLEDIISANVDITNCIADLETLIAKRLSDISLRPGVENWSENKIKRQHKIETIEERRLLTIAKGFSKTLKNLEYNKLK